MDSVEYDEINKYVDWINLMTYIMHGPGLFYHGSNFGTPLHASPNDPAGGIEAKKTNIAAAI
jgi:GH18 family chitinase